MIVLISLAELVLPCKDFQSVLYWSNACVWGGGGGGGGGDGTVLVKCVWQGGGRQNQALDNREYLVIIRDNFY